MEETPIVHKKELYDRVRRDDEFRMTHELVQSNDRLDESYLIEKIQQACGTIEERTRTVRGGKKRVFKGDAPKSLKDNQMRCTVQRSNYHLKKPRFKSLRHDYGFTSYHGDRRGGVWRAKHMVDDSIVNESIGFKPINVHGKVSGDETQKIELTYAYGYSSSHAPTGPFAEEFRKLCIDMNGELEIPPRKTTLFDFGGK